MSEIYLDFASDAEQSEYIQKVRALNLQYRESTGTSRKYLCRTFGCQQNENDTERISGMLDRMGYEPCLSEEDADFILFNTCAVRDHAEQRVFGKLGALVAYKRLKPSLVIALCGCMMQQPGLAEEVLKKYRHVNLVFGTQVMHRFPENLCKVLTTGQRISDTEQINGLVAENTPIHRGNSFKAWVSVMYGCNNFCSYCIVPYVRGRERSREPESVISEVRQLVSEGYKDITLLGQNVNSYCKGRADGYNFARLLRDINALDGDFRIRFMTSHPKDATRELIDTVADCEKVCKHLHLPFQSGSDRILTLMNRRYTRDDYISLTEYAASKIKGLVLTSDVIVGFPTETEEDFEDTLSLIEKVGFGGLYTFIYSMRKGTPAAEMPQIPDDVKHSRFDRLVKLQVELSERNNRRFVGNTERVLIEGYTNDTHTTQTGRTDTNIIVNFPDSGKAPGQFTDVKIDRASNWALFGNAE